MRWREGSGGGLAAAVDVVAAHVAAASSPEAGEGSGSVAPFTDLRAMALEVREDVLRDWELLIDRGAFIGGDVVDRFESEWAAYCDTTQAVGLANGTDALWLALLALGIGPGDEVIVPTNTFVATAEAVVMAGATPVFVDVDPRTLLLSRATVEPAITGRTAAVLVVHLYGQPADMDAMTALAERYSLALLEDAAQAHGATWNGRRVGSFGIAGCFSFYPGKNLGAFGDAGAVTTSDSGLAERLRSLRNHGRSVGEHHRHAAVGTNSRLDAIQAAVLSAKLKRLDGWTEARRSIAASYRAALGGSGIRLVEEAAPANGVYHLLVAMVERRDWFMRCLAERGIETGIHYPVPCHMQAPYRAYAGGSLPIAERASSEIISLPIFPHLTAEQISAVCGAALDLDARGGSGE